MKKAARAFLDKEFDVAMIRLHSLCGDIAKVIGDRKTMRHHRRVALRHAQNFSIDAAFAVNLLPSGNKREVK
jgi:hypothetical protein